MRPHGPVAGGRDLDVPGAGIRLRATLWRGSGPAVLLLHGLASQRRFWNLVVTRLGGLPVVALDQRGHGESEVPDTGYDQATVQQDALVALDALGLSRVVVVGHSWGAVTALGLAADHPERVLAAVALDGGVTTPSTRWTREEAREALAPPRFAVEPDRLVDVLRQGPLAPWWSPETEDAVLPLFGVDPTTGLARSRFPRDQHLQVVDALYDYDPAEVLRRVEVPAWVAVCTELGEQSDWSRDKVAGLAAAGELLTQPRCLTLAGAVHDVPLQWPGLVAGIVRAAVEEATTTVGQTTGTGGGG